MTTTTTLRRAGAAAILAGGLVTAPVGVVAASSGEPALSHIQATRHTAPAAKRAKGEHVTTGTVKSVAADELVIERAGKSHAEMAFSLGPSVHREGTVVVGSHVSIRYHEDGTKHVANAITVRSRS